MARKIVAYFFVLIFIYELSQVTAEYTIHLNSKIELPGYEKQAHGYQRTCKLNLSGENSLKDLEKALKEQKPSALPDNHKLNFPLMDGQVHEETTLEDIKAMTETAEDHAQIADVVVVKV
ncbi:hypothetical protein DdX_06986 [Ditylenchus destructor]|uniref:Uncharacterized protein n=1 Tax=Ditylenchus destructor TaxID=166010 RepID=A0AAD4N8I5_9BILA|nr:hypothetical protein DdX_06986 [Ditylenchus destructor]